VILYGAGAVLFILLMVVFESFILSSNTVYTMQPHLEITQTGFSPTQMNIFTGDMTITITVTGSDRGGSDDFSQ
jgi:hypothetical protein